MGVTRLKGRKRPWKVDWYAIEFVKGRRVKIRRAKFFTNADQARLYWRKKTTEVDDYVSGISNLIPIKFDRFIVDYLDSYLAYRSPEYQRSETSRLRLLVEYFADRELHLIKPSEVQAFLHRQLDAGWATKTAHNCLGLLSGIFTQAKIRQHVKTNPCERVSLPAAIQRREVRALSEVEIQKLLTISTPRERDVILTLLHTGMRLGELARFRVERDVDFQTRTIFVRSTEAAPTKNRRPRNVPLMPGLEPVLKRVKVGPVVPLAYHGIQSMLERLRDRSGIEFTAHWFRHSFASINMIGLGVPEGVVQRWLGHGSSQITRRYTHGQGLDQRWATMDIGRKFSCHTVARRGENAVNRGKLRESAGG